MSTDFFPLSVIQQSWSLCHPRILNFRSKSRKYHRHSFRFTTSSTACVAGPLLLLSGDVETNPGPGPADVVKCVWPRY